MRSATKSTKTIDLKYDPSGNRIFKDSSEAGQRKYIVDIVGDVPTTLMEMTDNTILKTYVYANGQVLCQHDGKYDAARYIYLHDRLGSIRQIVNTSGNVVKYYSYKPFGETLESGGSLENSFMFAGQYYDSEIAEYSLRARQYDPHIARFTARDPVFGQYKEPLTLHRYLYCLNAPVNCTDPGGLWTRHIMLSGMFSVGFSLMYQRGIVWDDDGNWGFITTHNDPQPLDSSHPESEGWGLGAGVPAVSGGIAFGQTNADTIFDLEGPGISVGGSFTFIASLGVDYISGTQRSGESYWGLEGTIGAGVSAIPGLESHGHETWTTIDPWNPTTRRDMINDYLGELFENSLYDVQTVGQGYFLLMFWDDLPYRSY